MDTSLHESEGENLFRVTMQGNWEGVVKIYERNPRAHRMRITHEGGTALHLAVIEGREVIVLKLVELISKNDKGALEIQNDIGYTPLHHAASAGSKTMCKHIVDAANPSLVGVRTNNTETALFIATVNGKKEAFFYLHSICSATSDPNSPDRYSYTRRPKDGANILHVAIAKGYFDLAYQIIHLYEDLVNSVNVIGITPFHTLANSTAFKSCSYNLGLWKRLIYQCIVVKELKVDPRSNPQYHEERNNVVGQNLKNGKLRNEQEGSSTSDVEIPITDDDTGSQSTTPSTEIQGIFPASYDKFIKPLMNLGAVLIGSKRMIKMVRELQELKKKHKWSDQVMNELFERSKFLYKHKGTGAVKKGKLPSEEEDQNDDDDMEQTFKLVEKEENLPSKMARTDNIVLTAAQNGVTEIVEKFLEVFPAVIHDRNKEMKNILILAAENRHANLYNVLIKRNVLSETTFLRVDLNDNNVLHVAAIYKKDRPWPIPGVALQMQWEIKWFQFVKDSIPAGISFRLNQDHETPEEVFSRTHEVLMKEGRDWLIKTSESCSVVAALIAGVAFATSAAIPGGTLGDSGRPIFEKQPAFQVFSVSSLIALCFSVTALVMFLAIITSRFQEKDFDRNLPVKLLLGLSSLFISIGAILVCFCTGHFFLIGDKLKYAAYPVYAMTCFPVSIFAAAQFPLYFDLLRTTFKNPFDHLHRYKI